MRGALEPPASVAEGVSFLTIADAFTEAGESPAPPPSGLNRRFICSFPDCSASYNKAWKLDAHLCKHTGEVTGHQPWGGGAWRPAPGIRDVVAGLAGPVREARGSTWVHMPLQDMFIFGSLDHRGEPALP